MQAPQNQNIRMSSGPICGGALPRPMSHQHKEEEPSSSGHVLCPVRKPLLEENHQSSIERASAVLLVTGHYPRPGLPGLNRHVSPGRHMATSGFGAASLNTTTQISLLLSFRLDSVSSKQDKSSLD